ncbi:MAG TPA: transglutaminase domain-containing protein [Draconibacterium sp.]|nr:transglutaminase domain-containing protein [Draconibacterium sp.]
MKAKQLLFVFFILLLTSCGKKEYYQVGVENTPFKPNIIFKSSEDLNNPGFSRLIEKYQLDTIFHGETDELKRILLLRQWIKSIVKIDDFGDPYPGEGNVEKMLDLAIEGQGYHCGHYMKIQNAIMNAYGYVTRTLGAGPGVQGGPDGHHGINEIWLNDYNKWFLSDAKYDHHFEKNGIPLSSLEVRDEYLKNKAADIVKVKGPDRMVIDADPETGTKKERSAQTYTWIGFHGYNDIFTAWHNHQEMNIMYEDDFFKNNTWIWGGKPHWTYDKPEYRILVKNRDAIEWTPNTIASEVNIDGNTATIELKSDTPNLKTYQMKESNSDNWQPVDGTISIDLNRNKHELLFRSMNLAGVSGPEHKIIIAKK